jgi:hypothetical protein
MLVEHFACMRLCVQTILHLHPVNLMGQVSLIRVGAKEDGQNVPRRNTSISATWRTAGASLWFGCS